MQLSEQRLGQCWGQVSHSGLKCFHEKQEAFHHGISK